MTLTETPPTPSGPTGDRPRRRGAVLVGTGVAAGLLVGAVGGTLAWELAGDRVFPLPEDGPAEVEEPRDAAPAEPEDAEAPGGDDAAGAGTSLPPLSWAPPELDDPEVVEISQDDRSLKLDLEQDYELVLPDEPLQGELSVYGGNDVVLVGGEIEVPADGQRALYLRDQTGTIHVEGVKLTGEGLGEGINLDQRLGGVVQLQNIWVGEVYGEVDGHHGDLIQSWAGPAELRIDGFTGSTGYQGFFLLPQQFGDQDEPRVFDLRRVDITGAEDGSGYMLWRDENDWPVEVQDVWVSPSDRDPEDREDFLWDRDGEDSWGEVEVGTPPGGPFVPEDAVGLGYVSPGYGRG